MLRIASHSLLKLAAIAALAITTTFSYGQTPAAPTPAPALAPLASPAVAADESGTAFTAVREAIARQDYNAARLALEQVRTSDPNNPGIAVYENIIERRQMQGQGIGVQSPLPTVRAGVTPEPRPVATPTPAPTPVMTPVPVATPAPEGMSAKVDDLMKNDMVKYGIIGLGALLLIGLIFWFMKKRRSSAEVEETPAITSGLGSYGDPLAGSDMGMSSPPLSSDYSTGMSAYGDMPESAPLGGSALGASSPAASGIGPDMSGFTMPSFQTEEEEEAEEARRRPAPAPRPVEDEGPVNLFDDEPPAPKAMPAEPFQSAPLEPMEPAEPSSLSSPAEPASFDALGINFGGNETTPLAPESLSRPFDDEDTVILSQPQPRLSNTTPTSTPSIAPGTVDLEDIFGSQPLPGETPAEDPNSHTLPTFVSTPGANNPEEALETPPAKNLRPAPEPASDTQSISFEELFGAPDATSTSTPAVSAAEEAPVSPSPIADLPPARAMGDNMSIEDALAATIGAMAEEKPFDEQPTIMESAPAEESGTESLDERSERMFLDQMDKARAAYNDKNWRQAVHFLSIASALHPEHEEARQMLKEARAEKRKAEESV